MRRILQTVAAGALALSLSGSAFGWLNLKRPTHVTLFGGLAHCSLVAPVRCTVEESPQAQARQSLREVKARAMRIAAAHRSTHVY